MIISSEKIGKILDTEDAKRLILLKEMADMLREDAFEEARGEMDYKEFADYVYRKCVFLLKDGADLKLKKYVLEMIIGELDETLD